MHCILLLKSAMYRQEDICNQQPLWLGVTRIIQHQKSRLCRHAHAAMPTPMPSIVLHADGLPHAHAPLAYMNTYTRDGSVEAPEAAVAAVQPPVGNTVTCNHHKGRKISYRIRLFWLTYDDKS